MKLELKGFRELERALAEELPKSVQRPVLNRAGKRALEPVRVRMSELAPYDPADRDEDGRHLRDTMRTQVAKAKTARKLGTERSAGTVLLTGPAPAGKRARGNANWQEDGTVKMAAHPYARPAADAEARNTVERVKEYLGDEIDKAKKRIARRAASKAKG